MESELKSLRIDRSQKRRSGGGGASPWATRFIIGGVLVFVLLGAWRMYAKLTAPREVEVAHVTATNTGGAGVAEGATVLNATGYIIAAHKIEVASKIVGRVAWIGVEKGDHVKQGQVLVRLEDEEYKAQLLQAKGQLDALEAKLAEMVNGSRPEEISRADADMAQARADQENAKVTLDRTRSLVQEGVLSKQALDDAKARYDSQEAHVRSLERSFQLIKIGPRHEQIDGVRGNIVEAKGRLAYYQNQLDNTLIKAPVTGTILERNVERGEFVTTGFVGDRGAKGYVVSLADLNDLKVELDINQNDFAKLGPKQKAMVNTDAYPDRKYEGVIDEVSPEANRQKATVQVKVKVLHPDEYLRPEMNANVAFVADAKPQSGGAPAKPVVYVPQAAVRGDSVYILSHGKAIKRAVKTGTTNASGVRVEDGLIGGEDLILSPPSDLKDGDRVQVKGA